MIKRIYILVILVFITGQFSCKTTPTSFTVERRSPSVLSEADKYFEQEKYPNALLKYSGYVFAPYPNKKRMDYARYRMGLCHYLMKEYTEAYETISILLEEYPDYESAKEAREILKISQAKMEEKRSASAVKLKALELQIQQQENRVKNESTNAEEHYKLANLYWAGGLYSDSVLEYQKAAALDPRYLEGATLKNRVRITSEGEWVVRDPLLEMTHTDDVQVISARIERLNRDDWFGEYEFLRVSGTVENKGLQDVQNVQIEISIYSVDETIQGTRLEHIGDLRAGGKRDFSCVFSEYTGLGIDIKKYTTQVFYEKNPIVVPNP